MRSFRLSLVVHVLILLACSLLILLCSGRSILRVEAAASAKPNSKPPSAPNDSRPVETANDVEILKRFVERYEPKSSGTKHIPSPPELKERELQSLKALSAAGSRAHEKYVLLIFLRLYRFHLENFQQSYYLIDEPLNPSDEFHINPLTKEFHKLIGSPPYETFLSGVAEDWVKSKPELLSDKSIAREIARIDRAHKKIESRSNRNLIKK